MKKSKNMHPNKNRPNSNKIPKRITLTNAPSTSISPINNTNIKFQNDKKMMSSSVGSPMTNVAMTTSKSTTENSFLSEKRTISTSEGMSLTSNESFLNKKHSPEKRTTSTSEEMSLTSNESFLNKKYSPEKRTMSTSEGMSLNESSANNKSSIIDFCSTDSKPNTELDLTVSRFGIVSNEALIYNTELSQLNERVLVQNMLKELRFVLEFDAEILEEQKYFWLSFITIISQEQRNRIKSTLENYCKTPVIWLSNNEIEININPEYRIVKQRIVC